jgi:hypothetical protein
LRPKKCIRRSMSETGWRQVAVILFLALLSALPASAQGQTAVVRSDPVVLEVSPGQVATLTIILANAQDVYGIDVRATFDPQIVEVVDADPARDGVQLTPGTFPQPDFVARNSADNAAGTLRYALTQVNPTAPATGTGVVFTVSFRGKTPGEATLALGPVEMADRRGQALPVTAEAGTIKVIAAEAPTVIAAASPVSPVPATTEVAPASSATSVPVQVFGIPADLPCVGGALLPALGLLGWAGGNAWRRTRR